MISVLQKTLFSSFRRVGAKISVPPLVVLLLLLLSRFSRVRLCATP